VPTGGRKKKLKHNIDASDVTTATRSRDVAAVISTMKRNVNAMIVALLTCSHRVYTSVTPTGAMRLKTAARSSRTVVSVERGGEAGRPEP
jgi:hypothetical protein